MFRLFAERWIQHSVPSTVWLLFHFQSLLGISQQTGQPEQPAVEDRARCHSSVWTIQLQESCCLLTRWCRGCKAVFYKWAKSTRNLELHWRQPFNTKMTPFQNPFPHCLTMGNNASKDYILPTKFIHSFIQLVPFCLCLAPSPSLPLAFLSADSCCDLNIINGFSGGA